MWDFNHPRPLLEKEGRISLWLKKRREFFRPKISNIRDSLDQGFSRTRIR
jgi:hypothetical protein